MTMVLVPLDGGRPIPLDKAILFFGRGPDCDVVLNTSRKVSRKHCCIAQIDDHFVVRDLGSMNGIRVNDRVVKGEMQLKPGEEFWVGDVGFRLQKLTAAGQDRAERRSPAPDVAKLPPLKAPFVPEFPESPLEEMPHADAGAGQEDSQLPRMIPPDQLRQLFDSDG